MTQPGILRRSLNWLAGAVAAVLILLAFLVAFFNQLSGINAILYFAPRIFELTGLGTKAALLQSVGIGITNLVFTFVGAAIVGAYYYFYEQQARTDLGVRDAELAAIQGRIEKGMETARKLPEFRAQVGDLEARLESLKAILPEEKDVAELLRRRGHVS